LLSSDRVMGQVLDELPDVITRDYYPYQIEIRTKPHISAEGMLMELKNNMELCQSVCDKYDLKIIPMSWLGSGEMFNGLHFHFRNGERNHFKESLFNSYPFILSLMDCFKFSPASSSYLTRRMRQSPHIQMPVIPNIQASARYSDVCVNRNRENNRHRLKKDNTMEIRIFDLPYNFKYLANLTKLLFSIMKFLNTKEMVGLPDISTIGGMQKMEDFVNNLYGTRQDIVVHATGKNYTLNKSNKEVYQWLCKKFKIEELKVPFTEAEPDWMMSRFVNNYSVSSYIGGE